LRDVYICVLRTLANWRPVCMHMQPAIRSHSTLTSGTMYLTYSPSSGPGVKTMPTPWSRFSLRGEDGLTKMFRSCTMASRARLRSSRPESASRQPPNPALERAHPPQPPPSGSLPSPPQTPRGSWACSRQSKRIHQCQEGAHSRRQRTQYRRGKCCFARCDAEGRGGYVAVDAYAFRPGLTDHARESDRN
jgi:hypothetical protein